MRQTPWAFCGHDLGGSNEGNQSHQDQETILGGTYEQRLGRSEEDHATTQSIEEWTVQIRAKVVPDEECTINEEKEATHDGKGKHEDFR